MSADENLTKLAVLPLRDVVVFPYMVIPLFVGRKKSIRALEEAMTQNKQILLVTQKDATLDDPKLADLHSVGTIATIIQLLKLPDSTVKVLVEGTQRATVTGFFDLGDHIGSEVKPIKTVQTNPKEMVVLTQTLLTQFEEFVRLYKEIPLEIIASVQGIDDPDRLADTIAAQLNLKVTDKQELLQISDLNVRLEKLLSFVNTEIDLLEVKKRLRSRVKRQMEKTQRKYYLNEQKDAIESELREIDEVPSETEDLERKIESAGMSKEAKEKAISELNKLKMTSPMSAEATVSRNYLDYLIGVPWKKRSKVSHDLVGAEKILDEDHYGLEKVKERIVEYLAVQQRMKVVKGPVLCLVGPPGVGKTSLGQSIAKATGRKFARIALGGVRDEAEIRGHRRTYIGSMPGKIVQKMCKVGVKNPLFLLDEIDKMAMDFRGDPAAALLEVLDPEQNNSFSDHYLEVDYDLSGVMFVCTANSLNIPPALLDRMEIIRIPGYTEDEKLNIAKQHLLPKQIAENGLKKSEIAIDDQVILDIVRYYTREAGVRSLERELAKLCRKVLKKILSTENLQDVAVHASDLEEYLGVRHFRYGLAEEQDQIGQVTGLAWTEVGGELLTIEAAVVPGKGKTSYTGQLGDVMQESIQAALTVVRSRSRSLGIAGDFYEKIDLHIHVPEGATPKDGPSAGIGMCTALVSGLTKIPVRADVAMTGEITLRGEVLPIGGLKEKLLAAARGGIKQVIIPEENKRDLKEIPKNILDGLKIHAVRWVDQVLEIALQHVPTPLADDAVAAVVATSKDDKVAKDSDQASHH